MGKGIGQEAIKEGREILVGRMQVSSLIMWAFCWYIFKLTLVFLRAGILLSFLKQMLKSSGMQILHQIRHKRLCSTWAALIMSRQALPEWLGKHAFPLAYSKLQAERREDKDCDAYVCVFFPPGLCQLILNKLSPIRQCYLH